MPSFYSDLSLSAQTAYAQLLDAALGAQLVRSVADLSGSFNAKTVKGNKYWYFQYTEPSGKLMQVYVGPDSEPVRRLMERKSGTSASAALGPLARSALALECTPLLPRQYRVIRRLADYGFFHAGGLLIGAHAFLAYGNMLGVRWGEQHHTQDIDFAHAGKAVALVLPNNVEVKTGEAISSLNMGFLPVSGLNERTGGACLIPAEPGFRLDFLTPLHRGGNAPYVHPQLHVTLQPLPSMEFSLEHLEQAVVFCSEGAVLINLPSPERFSLHKLLVFGERAGAFRVKASKDLVQAAHLLAYLLDHRREPFDEALNDLLSRGKGWFSRFKQGVQALNKAYPKLTAGKMLMSAISRR